MTITTNRDSQSLQVKLLETGHHETRFPARSSYVTIRIDPLGSVASMEDNDAATAAVKLSVKTYVGFVDGSRDVLHIGQLPIQSFGVHMLRPGLPPARPEEFLTSDMCIPVFPNADHPSRAPIQPIPALPWANACHAAFDHVALRVRASLADETLATVLSKEERMRLAMACALDYERRQDCIDEASACDSPTSSESATSGAEEHSVERRQWEITQSQPNTKPLVYMSYDLTGVKELCDPQDFIREIKVVQQLLKGARERQAEMTAQAIERARKIDEAAFSRPPSPPPSVTSAPLPEPTTATEATSGPLHGAPSPCQPSSSTREGSRSPFFNPSLVGLVLKHSPMREEVNQYSDQRKFQAPQSAIAIDYERKAMIIQGGATV
ncbi:hypothetical protein FIBSPDRAFT_925040 [Athelia psychrophila]|uniref:Uncharacterized protein n=1 Tax=Athelia psychrophila TaxID=1759441 RepID=A0A166VB30_9AGAM|nr:hypothetical protein FIBSPDRAFT_925040 [Fibularhizoctonia sp. CBS 109695]